MSLVLERPKTNTQPIKVHTDIQRGDIFMADISGVEGSIQGGIRPCVVISNSIGNKYSPVVIIAPISSSTTKRKLPTHVDLLAKQTGLLKDSVLLAEQVRVIDQWCLINKITQLDEATMLQVDKALVISLGLSYLYER